MNVKFISSSMDHSNPNSNSIPISNSNPYPISIPNSTFFSPSNSSSFSYFTQQALRAGFTVPQPRRREFDYPGIPSDIPGSLNRVLEKEKLNSNFNSYFTQQALRPGFTCPDPRRREFEYPGNQMDIPVSVQRELEKERIRAEIIAEDMIRRRILEEVVRMELMMEREMGLCRGGQRDFGSPGPMWGEPRVPLLTNYEHRAGIGVSPHQEVGIRGGGGGFETRPFQRDPLVAGIGNGGVNEGVGGSGSGVLLEEVKGAVVPTPEVLNNDKLIILAKPTPNLADLKRKALTSCAGDAAELLKRTKTKKDWSCALCRLTATSERALNEHLQGKKHKAREKGMGAQRTGFGTGPLPAIGTNTGKPIKAPVMSTNPSLKKDGKEGGEISLVKVDNGEPIKAPVVSNNPSLKEDGKEGGELSLVKVDNAIGGKPSQVDANTTLWKGKETSLENLENGEAKKPAAGKPKKKFRFFCEMCKVGAFSLKVFNTHKKGKRHLANLSKLNKIEIAPVEASSDKDTTAENKEPELAIKDIDGAEVGSVEINEASIGDMNPVVDKDEVFEIGGVTVGLGSTEEDKEPELAVEEIKEGAKVESVVNDNPVVHKDEVFEIDGGVNI